MKNKELLNELIEMLQYYCDTNANVTGIDFNYDRDDNDGELTIRTEKKDVSYDISL
jgi:hypothetical protein